MGVARALTESVVPTRVNRYSLYTCGVGGVPNFSQCTSEGLRKPDIIAIMGNVGLVIDAQVAGEQSDLERARTLKVQKYAGNRGIQRATEDLGATNILHLPAILSCRGVWTKKSADDLLRIGTINRQDLAIIATRVLIGGAIAHRVFNTSTAVKNWNSS